MMARFHSLPRWIWLLALGGASLGVYLVGLLAPYSLFTLGLPPLLDIDKLTRQRPIAQAAFVGTFALLFGLYYWAWRVCRSPHPTPRSMWIALGLSLLAFNSALVWLYPIDAADIFDNIFHGRLIAYYSDSPFSAAPKDYYRDPFFAYVAWPGDPSAYGPVWESLAALVSRLAGDDPLSNVLAFKGLNFIFYVGCVILIGLILRRLAPERAVSGVCLFAWNPLVLYTTVGTGHNDIALVFCVLLGAYAVLRRAFLWAIVALIVGALIKFISLLLIPLVLAAGLAQLSTAHDRWRFVSRAGGVAAVVSLLAYFPFWEGLQVFGYERRAALLTTSLAALAQVNLETFIGQKTSQTLMAQIALWLTGAMTLLLAGRLGWRWADRPSATAQFEAFLYAATRLFLFYLLITCLWFQPWYALWPLALAALLPDGDTARLAVLLTGAVFGKAIFFFFLSTYQRLPSRLWIETRLGPAVLALPWCYLLYCVLTRRARRASPVRPTSPPPSPGQSPSLTSHPPSVREQ